MRKSQVGFTIVELLIVIVVIAVLAAISIVAYNGVQNRANDSTVERNLSDIAKTIEIWKIDNNDAYPAIGQLINANIRINKSSYLSVVARNNIYYCISSGKDHYAFGVVSKSNQGYMLVDGNVTKRGESQVYQSNTCDAIGELSTSGTTGHDGANNIWSSWVRG